MSDRIKKEALRRYRRYQLEVVEGLNLCPWAKRARLEGRVRQWVSLSSAPKTDEVLEMIDQWTAEPSVEIGLAIFPRYRSSRSEFERFANRTLAADAERSGLSSPAFVLAAFHPDAAWDPSTPERMIPFLRRTPDPTLQLVRVVALERVRQGETSGTQFIDTQNLDLASLTFSAPGPALRDRVATANQTTMMRLGEERSRALIEGIHRDGQGVRDTLAGDSDEDDAPQ